MGHRELPDGWQWQRLGDILPLQYGKALKAADRVTGGGYPVYGSAGITGSHDEALFSGPALIVGRKGSAGAVYYSGGPAYAIDTAYFCTTAAAKIDLRLGYHLLTYLKLRRLDQSTAVPSLSRDTYSDVVVPIPPTSSQPGLAAKIDELFAELDNADEALSRAKDDAGAWRTAVLKSAVGGEMTAEWRSAHHTQTGEDLLKRILADRRSRWFLDERNRNKRYIEPAGLDASDLPILPSSWTWASLGQIALVSGGLTIDAKRRPINPVEVPYLRVANVQRGFLDLRALKTVTIEKSTLNSLRLVPGDILLNEGGDRDKVGRGWVFEGQIENCAHQNHVFKARLVSDEINPYLVSMYLNEIGRRFFIDESKQTTNLASISLGKISRAPVPIPPAAEVAEIMSALAGQRESMIDDEISRMFEGSSTLRETILAAAFRGDLVQ